MDEMGRSPGMGLSQHVQEAFLPAQESHTLELEECGSQCDQAAGVDDVPGYKKEVDSRSMANDEDQQA